MKTLPSSLQESLFSLPRLTQGTQPLFTPSVPLLGLNTSRYHLLAASPLQMGEGSHSCTERLELLKVWKEGRRTGETRLCPVWCFLALTIEAP